MPSALVATLQAQIDRFAEPGEFPTIDIDGDYGSDTTTALLNALTWISKDGCASWIACADDDLRAAANTFISQIAPNGQVDSSRVQGFMLPIAAYLTNVGDQLGLDTPWVPDWLFASSDRSSAGPPGGAPDQAWCLMFPGDAGCSTFLQAVATKQRSSAITAPHAGTIPPKRTLPAKLPSTSSLMARFQRLPTWQKVGLGAGAVLGALFLNKRRVAARKRAA